MRLQRTEAGPSLLPIMPRKTIGNHPTTVGLELGWDMFLGCHEAKEEWMKGPKNTSRAFVQALYGWYVTAKGSG